MNLKDKIIIAGSSFAVVGIFFLLGAGASWRQTQRAQNFAREVGYANPREVVNFYNRDIDNDRQNDDILLKLRDGRKIKYIHHGYTPVE